VRSFETSLSFLLVYENIFFFTSVKFRFNGYFFRWLINLVAWMTCLFYSNLHSKIISGGKKNLGFLLL
jgi:hypothetical protein